MEEVDYESQDLTHEEVLRRSTFPHLPMPSQQNFGLTHDGGDEVDKREREYREETVKKDVQWT